MMRWAEWLYDHRVSAGVIILVVTAFFGWQIRHLDIATYFRDLYPTNHPHTKLFEKYPAFGSPLTVSLVVQAKTGSIYNPETLGKIQEATKLVDLMPGVDHDQVVSIASRKVKHVEATIGGVQATNLLVGPIPETPEQIERLRDRVRSTTGVIGTLVSGQEDAALVQATFIERLADYNVIFRGINNIIEKLKDNNHEVYAAGQPMLTGWVYFYERQMFLIFAVTILGMVLFLALHMRNLAGVVTPIVVSAATALWGFGIAGLFDVSIDPLIMVLPMLLVARSFSHAVQACERYFEIYSDTQSKRDACVGSLVSIFPPGTLGVVTDAAGLFFIAVAPMPVMDKVAFLCGFWALSLIPANVLFTPIILSFLPVPRNAPQVVGRARVGESAGWFRRIAGVFDQSIDGVLGVSGRLSHGRIAWATVLVLALVLVWAGVKANHLAVGDTHPGTSLLWPSSPYNTAVKRINQRFAGFDVLQVVVESDKPEGVKTSKNLDLIQRFQRYMERDPEVGGTFSFADLVPQINRLFHGGLPKWNVIPEHDADAAMLFQLAMSGASPGDFDRLFTRGYKAASVSVWYKDHRSETIERALRRAEGFMAAEKGAKTDGSKLRLASGTIGLAGAINETVARSELYILLLVLATVFVTCSLTYRSFVAALLLLIPVNVSNLIASAIMVEMGIGLDINTLPVAAVGIGVGIDYGIYLMSRICEEYQVLRSYERAITNAVRTTGRAIFFTGTTLLVGVIPWYFLSDLRFQADMGLLIGYLMLINMVIAIVLVPLLIYIIQPKFVGRVRYIVAGKTS
jgi:predicted RND superfamily exporter protein